MLDAHTHVFPPEFCSRREDFFADEPGFRLLYDSPKSKMVGPEELVRGLDEEGMDGAVVLGFPWRREQNWRRHNEVILEAMRRWPRRLMGFCAVNPRFPGAVREVERCLAAGARGVGELAFYMTDRSEDLTALLAPIAELCHHYQAPLLLHATDRAGPEYPGRMLTPLAAVYKAIKAFPETIWILAHWGGRLPFYGLLKKEAPEILRNVYYDTAASPFIYRPVIYRVVAEMVGPEKILFGSDYPLLGLKRYLDDMAEANLPEDWKEMILGKNLAKLMNWEG
ncbi:MAG: amidohydrolase [Deltaproteobacteria bacterium]|nr:amidohydrolase [Deltaproteobacteria bacterium]